MITITLNSSETNFVLSALRTRVALDREYADKARALNNTRLAQKFDGDANDGQSIINRLTLI